MSNKAVNLAEVGPVLGLRNVEVREYHPQQDGKGSPTEVHIVAELPLGEDMVVPVCIPLGSRGHLEDLVAALEKHADGVWGALS